MTENLYIKNSYYILVILLHQYDNINFVSIAFVYRHQMTETSLLIIQKTGSMKMSWSSFLNWYDIAIIIILISILWLYYYAYYYYIYYYYYIFYTYHYDYIVNIMNMYIIWYDYNTTRLPVRGLFFAADCVWLCCLTCCNWMDEYG